MLRVQRMDILPPTRSSRISCSSGWPSGWLPWSSLSSSSSSTSQSASPASSPASSSMSSLLALLCLRRSAARPVLIAAAAAAAADHAIALALIFFVFQAPGGFKGNKDERCEGVCGVRCVRVVRSVRCVRVVRSVCNVVSVCRRNRTYGNPENARRGRLCRVLGAFTCRNSAAWARSLPQNFLAAARHSTAACPSWQCGGRIGDCCLHV